MILSKVLFITHSSAPKSTWLGANPVARLEKICLVVFEKSSLAG